MGVEFHMTSRTAACVCVLCVPGCVDAQGCHCLVASLLRQVLHLIQQVFFVPELVQIHSVGHILAVGHNAHLQHTQGQPSTFNSSTNFSLALSLSSTTSVDEGDEVTSPETE